MKTYKLLLALIIINISYTMELKQSHEKLHGIKTLVENCKSYIIKNVDRYFQQILMGRLPEELSENILDKINLYRNYLEDIFECLEDDSLSEKVKETIIKKIYPSYSDLAYDKRISKRKFDKYFGSKTNTKIDTKDGVHTRLISDNTKRTLDAVIVYAQELHMEVQIYDAQRWHHRVWHCYKRLCPWPIRIVNAIINDDFQVGTELSNGKYVRIVFPSNLIDNKLNIDQKILMSVVQEIAREENFWLTPANLALIEKIEQSKILKTLPQNEFLVCKYVLRNKKKVLLDKKIKYMQEFKTPAKYNISMGGSTPEQDLKKLRKFLQIYRHCNYVNIVDDLEHLSPTRTNKKIIKKLKDFIEKNFKNLNIDSDLFDVAYKLNMNSSEYEKMVNNKLKAIICRIWEQKDLNQDEFKKFLLKQLEESAIQYFCY